MLLVYSERRFQGPLSNVRVKALLSWKAAGLRPSAPAPHRQDASKRVAPPPVLALLLRRALRIAAEPPRNERAPNHRVLTSPGSRRSQADTSLPDTDRRSSGRLPDTAQ